MYSFLSMLGSIALYGMVSLLLTLFGFNTDFATIQAASIDPGSARDLFYALMFWSLIAYPLIVAVELLYLRIWWVFSQRRLNGHMKFKTYSVLRAVVQGHVIQPFTVFTLESRETDQYLVRVFMGGAFWACFALGYASLVVN
jgi:hypothetical protein